jgi:thiol-disulfide isomerase/thioredoxin
MKNLLMFLLLCPYAAKANDSLLHKQAPTWQVNTISGKQIDAPYYKGRVTLVTFMYIGCPPCMNEISMLNRLQQEYKSDARVQLLAVARQTAQQMTEFNAINNTIHSKIRQALGVEPIAYEILPACGNNTGKIPDTNSAVINIGSECDVLERTLGIEMYPTTIFIDKNGIIRKVQKGGPVSKADNTFYNEDLKKPIDQLLSE